jgi:hypothetical protein
MFGKLGPVLRVSAVDRRLLFAFSQPLERVLANRLEHDEARLALDALRAAQEVAVNE